MSRMSRRDVLKAAGGGAAAIALAGCASAGTGEGKGAPAPIPIPPEGAFVDLPTGIRMYYEIHGTKGDPFLLLGGTGSHHGLWTHHLPELTKDFRVITPDPRGTGRTSCPADPTTCTIHVTAEDAAAPLHPLALGPAQVARLLPS